MSRTKRPVPLNFEERGMDGRVIVILHGLLGSLRNWRFVTVELSKNNRAYALDLRNHGASPHTGPFTLDDLVDDVEAWIESKASDAPVTVMGHSLGGKVAMRLACRRPDLVSGLILVDISSEPAPRRWGGVFAAMQSLDLTTLRDRKQAEDHFEANGITDWAFRRFLSSNLETDGKAWRWKIGLYALASSSENIISAVLEDGDKFDGPTLLIRGELSPYAPLSDIPAMTGHFPSLRVETIPNAGHNVHIDAPHGFLNSVRQFMDV